MQTNEIERNGNYNAFLTFRFPTYVKELSNSTHLLLILICGYCLTPPGHLLARTGTTTERDVGGPAC